MCRLFLGNLPQQPSFMFGDGNNIYHDEPIAIYAALILVTFSVTFDPNIYVLLRLLKGRIFNVIFEVPKPLLLEYIS